MERLEEYIQHFVKFNSSELKVFMNLFKKCSLKKGDYFAKDEVVESNIGFLQEGVIRAFYRSKDGVEYNKAFFTDHELFGAYSSMVTKKKNQINLQALTDCEILVASYNEMEALFDQYQAIERLARKLAEYFYVYKEKREIDIVLLNAEERYELFKEEYPHIENIIPQYHIASYLGVTPTQLSRIRSKK